MKVKPMKLGRVDQITYILLAVTAILLLLAGWLDVTALFYGALVFFLAMVIFRVIYWRCPACGKFLWRNRKEVCKNCGGKLER